MSREVNMSKPDTWDEDDVQYLRDRGLLPADFESEPEEEEPQGYKAMKKKQLLALAEERGIEVEESATKQDIVDALEEDDQAS